MGMEIFETQSHLQKHLASLFEDRSYSLRSVCEDSGIPKTTLSRRVSGESKFTSDEVFWLLQSFGYTKVQIKNVFVNLFPEELKKSKFKVLLVENDNEFLNKKLDLFMQDPKYFDILNKGTLDSNDGKIQNMGFSKDEYVKKFGIDGESRINFLMSEGLIEEKSGRILTLIKGDYQVSLACVKKSIINSIAYHDESQMGKNKYVVSHQSYSISEKERQNCCISASINRKFVRDIAKTGTISDVTLHEVLKLKERLDKELELNPERDLKTVKFSYGQIATDYDLPTEDRKGEVLQ